MKLAFILPAMACGSYLFNYSYFIALLSKMLNFLHGIPLKMSMCLEMGLGCSFQFKYQVPALNIWQLFITVLSSSFCQSIEYTCKLVD